jgi:hypothetical protein
MGIRIHKALGYALLDLSCTIQNEEIVEINDQRLNVNGYFHSFDAKLNKNMGDFLSFYYKKREVYNGYFFCSSHLFLNEESKKTQIRECVLYESEELGFANILLFVPPSMVNQGWYHHDDPIDYYSQKYNIGMSPDYQYLPDGIFPWETSYQNKNGERWTNSDNHLFYSHALDFRRCMNTINDPKIDEQTKNDFYEVATNTAQYLGFETVEEAEENIVPVVPDEIKALCEYLEIFNDINVVNQLRPIIYTFWR